MKNSLAEPFTTSDLQMDRVCTYNLNPHRAVVVVVVVVIIHAVL